jgi:hypothetical protein
MVSKNKILIFILVLSFFLRLTSLNYMEFKGDEAHNSFKALDFVENGKLPLTALRGTTGLNYPPIFIYLISIPYAFSTNPIVATGFIALANVLATFICFVLVNKLFNKKAAIISALLFTVNPWQVIFSRKLWDVNFSALFIFLLLLFLYNTFQENKKSHLAYAMLTLGILLQLHISLSYILLPALIMIIPYHKKIDKKYLAIGTILFLITLIPYSIFEMKNNFIDFKTLSEKSGENYFHPTAFIIPFKMISTLGFNGDMGNSFQSFITPFKSFYLIDFIVMFLLLVSIIYLFKTKYKAYSWWFLIGVLYLAISKVPSIDTNYFTSLLPISFIIMGVALASIIRKSSKNTQMAIYIFLFIIIIHQLAFSFHFIDFISNNECIDGNYGMPYQYRLDYIQNTINNENIASPSERIEEINTQSCDCKKCDLKAAEYIINEVIS